MNKVKRELNMRISERKLIRSVIRSVIKESLYGSDWRGNIYVCIVNKTEGYTCY